jgi:hypothetical protein
MGEVMKTLGQIACEKFYVGGRTEDPWNTFADRDQWKAAAQAVRAAVIEECAKAITAQIIVNSTDYKDNVINDVLEQAADIVRALK